MAQIHLKSAHAAVTLDPTRGGEFVSFTTGESDNLLFYDEWRAPLSADRGPVYGSTELDWLSRYNGGWQVLFPNAGAESVIDGVPTAFHGETSLADLDVESVAADSCVLRAYARLPLELTRTVRLSAERAAVLVEESVTNVGTSPVGFIWGHHPTFPAVPGSMIDAPAARVEVEPATPGPLGTSHFQWPRAKTAQGADEDVSVIPSTQQVRLLYLRDLREGWVAMRPPAASDRQGVALSWDSRTFPHMWLWLQNGDPGFPWYGRSRMVGLEPQRSWPFDGAAAASKRGQAITIQPAETVTSWITLSAFTPSGTVTGVERDGRVHSTP